MSVKFGRLVGNVDECKITTFSGNVDEWKIWTFSGKCGRVENLDEWKIWAFRAKFGRFVGNLDVAWEIWTF